MGGRVRWSSEFEASPKTRSYRIPRATYQSYKRGGRTDKIDTETL